MQINKIPIGYIIAPLWDNAEALKYQQGPYSFCCAPILPPPDAADSINVHIGKILAYLGPRLDLRKTNKVLIHFSGLPFWYRLVLTDSMPGWDQGPSLKKQINLPAPRFKERRDQDP